MNIVFVQSLIMNILFGITDENFKTLQNSILNVYLLSIGDNHPMSIVTFSTAIRNVFSSILSISTMLLTNMFVAIIWSHYYEYYLQQAGSKLSSVRMFINALLGDPKNYGNKQGQPWIKRFRNIVFKFLHKWVNNIIEDKTAFNFDNTKNLKI